MLYRFLLATLLWSAAFGANAKELSICYNFDCAKKANIHLRDDQLARIHLPFSWTWDAEGERQAISWAIGQIHIIAGEQTPTFRDLGRNRQDEDVDGRMDCIDHSLNNSAYLHLMDELGWLQFHSVLEPVRRAPLIFIEHWSARIAEKSDGQEFVVDSWFFSNGHAATIYTVEEWMTGVEPNE